MTENTLNPETVAQLEETITARFNAAIKGYPKNVVDMVTAASNVSTFLRMSLSLARADGLSDKTLAVMEECHGRALASVADILTSGNIDRLAALRLFTTLEEIQHDTAVAIDGLARTDVSAILRKAFQH